MRIKILIFGFVMLATLHSCSQGTGIEYTFDRAVNAEIQSYIKRQLEQDSTRSFYFYLTKSVSKNEHNNHQLFIASYVGEQPDFVKSILNSTNRFYTYERKRIPIFFDYDFKFIGYGSENGVIKRKTLTGTLYFIEFTSTGKVIRTGT
jgi:hypothetical protein